MKLFQSATTTKTKKQDIGFRHSHVVDVTPFTKHNVTKTITQEMVINFPFVRHAFLKTKEGTTLSNLVIHNH